MKNQETIDKIVSKLNEKKPLFLSEVESAIFQCIENSTITDCLTIVMRNSSGSVSSTWYPKEVLKGYLPRFVAFMRRERYDGFTVDSYLTDKVVRVVTNKFNSFYNSNSNVISKPLLGALLQDSVFATSLSKHIVDRTNSALPAAVRSQLTNMLVHKLETEIGHDIVSSSAHTLSVAISKAVSVAVAIPITKSMAAILMKHFAIVIKGTLAKVLASSAIKSMLMTTVKKIVAVKILGALIALVASKLGITAGGAVVGFIIAPILAGFIAHEVYTLPKKLAKKVSEEVRKELSGQFSSVNKSIVTSLVTGIGTSVASSFFNDVANDPEMKETMKRLVKELSA